MRALDQLCRDLAFAVRMLHKAPLTTATIVLTLALGVGVNTAVFGVVNAVLLRPLQVRDGDRLVVLASRDPSGPRLGTMSSPDIDDFRTAAAGVFEDVAGYNVGFLGLARDGAETERVLATSVSASYFPLLDLQPAAGRLFVGDEGRAGRTDALVVLGYSSWIKRFAGDPAVVGSTVRVDGRPCTIVGVAPPGFFGTFAFSDSELYLPLNWRGGADLEDRTVRSLHAFARLRPGVTIADAQAAATALAERLAREYPDSNADLGVRVVPERLARPEEDQARSNALGATIMLALAGVVSILAAVNVANLLLSRMTSRRHELAIRVALGASRGGLVRQWLVETALLAALSGVFGSVLAMWVTRALATIRLPGDLPVRLDFAFDARVTLYAAALTLAIGLAVGLVPAARAAGMSPPGSSSRAASAPRGRDRTRGALAAAQIALSFVLLFAAGLFARSLIEAERVDLGFQPQGLLNIHMDVSQLGYTEEQGWRFFEDVERRVAALPGVERLGFAFTVPLGYVRAGAALEAEGRATEPHRGYSAGMNSVSPGYFATMGVSILAGRVFVADDSESARPVAIVNQQLAQTLWPASDPIGRRFKRTADEGWTEVVGVVSTGKYESLFEAPQPFFYVPQAQAYTAQRVLHVRTALDPQSLLSAVERAIREYEPALPLYDAQTMERALGSGPGLFPVRVVAAATAVFGTLALTLATVGTYAVVSYLTGQRTREIAVRVAVGAPRRRILGLIVGDGAKLVVVGLAGGGALALLVASMFENLLFGVSPRDLATFALIAILLGGIGLLASALPAWRAARVDPTSALRTE